MPDTLTHEQRRLCMSKVRGKDTTPELTLRKALWRLGLRYRLHCKLPGKPDIVFVSARVAVFVDGCFWHGCPQHGSIPKTNRKFWKEKINGNIVRDKEVTAKLEELGWTVLRFWTHELKENLESVLVKVANTVKKSNIRNG